MFNTEGRGGMPSLVQLTVALPETGKRVGLPALADAVRVQLNSKPSNVGLLNDLTPGSDVLVYLYHEETLLDAQRQALACVGPMYDRGVIDARSMVKWVAAALDDDRFEADVGAFVAARLPAARGQHRKWLQNVALVLAVRRRH